MQPHARLHARLPALLALALALALSAAAVEPQPHLVHLPLTRRPVPAARVFSQVRRPWALRLARAQSERPSNSSLSASAWRSHLSFPLTLASVHGSTRAVERRKALPEQAMFGDIVTLGEYYVTLIFGGQPINVQIDTGSSTLAVPLKQCLNCRKRDHRLDLEAATGTSGFIACSSSACQPNSCHLLASCTVCSLKSNACCSVVAPDACGFYLQYADSSGASGALVQTDVGIAGLVTPLIFGAILRETEDFENTNVDGILGLAYKSLACNPTCVLPLFDTLVQSGKVKKDIFSMCTTRNGGTLTLGGSKPEFFKGDLQYVPMIHKGTPHFYDVAVKKVEVGGNKVSVPDFKDGIVDSGTTVLVLAPKAYKALQAYFQENYCNVPGLCLTGSGRQAATAHLIKGPAKLLGKQDAHMSTSERETGEEHSWFSPGYCVRLNEEHIKLLPDITIGLENGVKLVLDPDTYMLQYELTSTFGWEKVIYRCLGITFLEGLEKMENNAIFGNTILQKYFVEYDRENKRIGFAIGKNCIDPETRMLGAASSISGGDVSTLPPWAIVALVFGSIIAWVLLVSICARESRKYSGYRPIPGPTTLSLR